MKFQYLVLTALFILPTHALADDRRGNEPGRDNARGANRCGAAGSTRLEDPRIEIIDENSPQSARTIRVKGFIEGVCLTEAGLYQSGQQKKRIPVETLPTFKRFEFQVTAAPGKQREIRVYNTQGGRAAVELPDTDLSDDPLGIGVDRPSDVNEEGEEEEDSDDTYDESESSDR